MPCVTPNGKSVVWRRVDVRYQEVIRKLDRAVRGVRHGRLEDKMWLWDRVRPAYKLGLSVFARKGLVRVVNGTDRLRVAPRFGVLPETYEPELWTHLMDGLRPGDTVADVGANVGLYSVAAAQRVGPSGRVSAFEPDAENFEGLRENVALNGVRDRVEVLGAAVGATDGTAQFAAGRGLESRITTSVGAGEPVELMCLDSVFADRRVDVVKIDVEGFEAEVIKGATGLLRDPQRRPRRIYIEVHPSARAEYGFDDTTLLTELTTAGYQVRNLAGEEVDRVEELGWVVASPRDEQT